jgi:acetyl-CoA synthetase
MHHTNEDSQAAEVIPPPPHFVQKAAIASPQQYQELWQQSIADPLAFWQKHAKELLHWDTPWHTTFLDSGEHHYQWFVGGSLNASYNCLDRHLATRGNKIALIWEGEGGGRRSFTYQQLHEAVARCASGLAALGLKAGEVVTLYMPMVPELTITMLACARMGLTHNVVFAGFSAEALASRLNDAASRVLITADGGMRRGKVIPLYEIAETALASTPQVNQLIVLSHLGLSCKKIPGLHSTSWQSLIDEHTALHPALPLPSEQPLFMLYTSGSTGKPKGILHTTGGYLLGATLTCRTIFDVKEDDILWCTADQGWITGHTYGIYGPLGLGMTVLMYEGALDYPGPERVWQLIASHRVSIFYTAPTALRASRQQGAELPLQHDLSSLRLLGSVGEMINPSVWKWFYEKVGRRNCPLIDTWWQTETGATMVTTVPGALASKPGAAGRPLGGINLKIVDEAGQEVPTGQEGYLVLTHPWPYMMRTILGDHQRFISQYWQRFPGYYFTGDFARVDKDGYLWILGRCDDVINIAAHRISTMEVESILLAHPGVAEAAAVGAADAIKGQSLVCFVTCSPAGRAIKDLRQELTSYVASQIGSFARPRELCIVEGLPKTRSGKIMRRLLRDIAEGRKISGDISTLESTLTVPASLQSPE